MSSSVKILVLFAWFNIQASLAHPLEENKTTPASTEKYCCATIFDTDDFHGNEKELCGDLSDVHKAWGRSYGISSMNIDDDCIVEAYDEINYQGEMKVYKSKIDLWLNDSPWNDEIRSLKVKPASRTMGTTGFNGTMRTTETKKTKATTSINGTTGFKETTRTTANTGFKETTTTTGIKRTNATMGINRTTGFKETTRTTANTGFKATTTTTGIKGTKATMGINRTMGFKETTRTTATTGFKATTTTARNCCATIFDIDDFHGHEKKLCGDQSDVYGAWGRSFGISSMNIDEGCIVEAYWYINYGGPMKVYKSKIDFWLNDSWWNDKIRSLKVKPE